MLPWQLEEIATLNVRSAFLRNVLSVNFWHTIIPLLVKSDVLEVFFAVGMLCRIEFHITCTLSGLSFRNPESCPLFDLLERNLG